MVEECEKFSLFLRGLLAAESPDRPSPTAIQTINWYRIAMSAELVLPRIFLLFAVGTAYLELSDATFVRTFASTAPCDGISSKAALLQSIQDSLLGLCDPVRGVVVRHLVLGGLLPFLPLPADEQALAASLRPPPTGGVRAILAPEQAIEALVQEFALTNVLWVRIKYDQQLQTTVDSTRLSREMLCECVTQPINILGRLVATLSGGDDAEPYRAQVYRTKVLQVIMQHVVGCRDEMAQEHLMMAILNAFPVALHLATVEGLLEGMAQFVPSVNFRQQIAALIDRIVPEAGGPADAVLIDTLWCRIRDMLEQRSAGIHRGKTVDLEKTIELCLPLLRHALGAKPFAAERVETILAFLLTRLEEEDGSRDDQHRLLVSTGRVVDLVLELVPTAQLLLRLESLYGLLAYLHRAGWESSAGLAFATLGRLAESGYKLGAGDVEMVVRWVLIISGSKGRRQPRGEGQEGGADRDDGRDHGSPPRADNFDGQAVLTGECRNVRRQSLDELVERARMLESVAQQLFNVLLNTGDPRKDIDQGQQVLDKLLRHQIPLLFAIILLPVAINALLISQATPAAIKGRMGEWRAYFGGKQVEEEEGVPPLPPSRVEETQGEAQRLLTSYLYDAPSVVLAGIWGRCAEVWHRQPAPSADATNDDVYYALVEMLAIFEEEATDEHAQERILYGILRILSECQGRLGAADASGLLGKILGCTRRILKGARRLALLLELLGLLARMGTPVEVDLVKRTAQSATPLIAPEVIGERLQLVHALITFMRHTEPNPVRVPPSAAPADGHFRSWDGSSLNTSPTCKIRESRRRMPRRSLLPPKPSTSKYRKSGTSWPPCCAPSIPRRRKRINTRCQVRPCQ